MSNQALVIGLGQFGMSLARAMALHGSEVLAVDIRQDHVNAIAPHIAEAVVLNAMDEAALASLAPSQRDVCVCAIGDENREGGIIVTALLKQLGAPHIIARATDALHARILTLIGAHEVISPERNYGERLAVRLAWQNVVNMISLGDGMVLTEIQAPEPYWGRTVPELKLQGQGVVVSGIRVQGATGTKATIPDPTHLISPQDVLLLVSTEHDARALTERL